MPISWKAAAVIAGLASSGGASFDSGSCEAGAGECEHTALLQAKVQADPVQAAADASVALAGDLAEKPWKAPAKPHAGAHGGSHGGSHGGGSKGTKVVGKSFAAGLVHGNKNNFWNMPVAQDKHLLDKLHADLTNVPLPSDGALKKAIGSIDLTFAKGPASKVVSSMHRATTVEGVSNLLPKDLRGIHWMMGNAEPAELISVEYGRWFEDEGVLLATWSPFGWAWPAGKPPGQKSGMYSRDESAGLFNAQVYMRLQPTISHKFSKCKEGKEYTARPIVCDEADSKDEHAYAYMQIHELGNLAEPSQIGYLMSAVAGSKPDSTSGAFTMQKNPKYSDGSAYRRVSQWDKRGGSGPSQESNSYDFVKILDADGKPVQPWYDKFMEYMGSTQLLTWTGGDLDAYRTYLEHLQTSIAKGKVAPLMPSV